MNYSVYVIKCSEGRLYIGMSSNIRQRLEAHNARLSKWTSSYTDWELIYKKDFDNFSDARKWEIYLKKQKGGIKLKKIINYSGMEQSGSSRGS